MDPSRNPSAGIAAAASSGLPSIGLPSTGLTRGEIFLIVIGGLLTLFTLIAPSYAIYYGYSISPEGSFEQNLLLGVGSVALVVSVVMTIYIIMRVTKTSLGLNIGLANTSTVLVVLLVAAIAFLIVFSPAISGDFGAQNPWAVAALVFISILVFGVIFGVAFKNVNQNLFATTISHLTLILFYFLPYALLTFGPIVDILTTKFQFLPATVVGITSIFMNWLVATFFNGGIPPTATDVTCEIPGLTYFSSNIVPQPMMASLSMLAYMATYISRSTLSGTAIHPSITFANSSSAIWPSWALYGGITALYFMVLYNKGCMTLKALPAAMIIPSVYGGIFGILGFEFLAPRYDPTGLGPSNSKPVLGGAGSTTPTGGTCAAGSSDGEFICESFENGKLKTTVMTE